MKRLTHSTGSGLMLSRVEVLKISPKNFNFAIKKTVKLIKQGGVIICPTDTVYGLISDAQNEKAVKKNFKIKKRKEKKPIPIFVKDLKMAKKFAIINKSQENFLKKFWPGKLTAVLNTRTKKFPKGILSKDGKIGLRVPKNRIINQLLMIINSPLTGTSANISGKPESTKIKEVLEQFKCKNWHGCPDLILDAGNLKPSLSSTVIDLTNFKILREGQIPKRKISKILKKII